MRSQKDRYIFIIDTDTYAGNFERELCAYMTGIVGECGVGEESIKLYEKEGLEPLEDLVDAWVPDDKGCCRPVAIQPTPGWFNDGYGGHYRESAYDEAEVLKTRNQAIEDDAQKAEMVYADKGYGKQEADRKRERKNEKLVKYPAYNSVGIYLQRQPTSEEVKFLQDRALKFVTETGKKSRFSIEFCMNQFKIEAFRLVVEKTIQEEIAL